MKTDMQLRQDILQELRWDPSLNAAGVDVDVDAGSVKLKGRVDTFIDTINVQRAAQRVAGVNAVSADMRVALLESARRSDTDMARTARNVLQWNVAVPSNRVSVTVEDGWVTLSGDVDWSFQRQAAEAALQHLTGTTGLTVDIAVVPAATPGDLQSTIEAALRRSSPAAGARIVVSSNDSEVTLSGPVHSHSERELAITSAWRAAGVRSVVDRLRLETPDLGRASGH